MSPTDVKTSESNILRGTRGNLNEAAADAAGMVLRVGLRRGAGSPLVAVPPVPWGHTHLQKLCRGPGVVGRVHGPSPTPQTNGFPWVGQLSPPPETRVLSIISTSSCSIELTPLSASLSGAVTVWCR